METATLSSKGQLVVPKAIRDDAGVSAGSQFSVSYVDGEIRLRPLRPSAPTTLAQVAGCLAKAGRQRLSEAQLKASIGARLKVRNAPLSSRDRAVIEPSSR
jgi:AbrB family looped-hinge helix DNA binding protein